MAASDLAPGAILFDFMAMQAAGGTLDSRLTFSRASQAWGFGSNGLLATYANNVPVFEWDWITLQPLGLRIERTGLNGLIPARTVASAAWTKTNCTAATTATGIDGAANSASTVTATGANATAINNGTAVSSWTCCSIYLKRVTGTGPIAITADGGTTWTDITAQLTTNWGRFLTPGAAITNPGIGMRISTSGDVIAADYAYIQRNEVSNTTTAMSPILTVSTAVTRASDLLTASLSTLGITAANGISASLTLMREAGTGAITDLTIDDGTVSNLVQYKDVSSSNLRGQLLTVNAGAASQFRNVPVDQLHQTGQVFGVAIATRGIDGAISVNGNPPLPIGIAGGTPSTALNALRLGSDQSNSINASRGWFRRLILWPYMLSMPALQAASTPYGV